MTSSTSTPEPVVTREGDTVRRIDLRIDAAEVEAVLDAAARGMSRKLNLPGFRKGRVPVPVVRKRFAQELREEIIEQLASRHVSSVLDSTDEAPVAPPVLREHEFLDDGALRLVAQFEVQPPIKLGEYRGLKATRPASAIQDQDVDEALASLQRGMTKLQPVESRGAQEGDDVLVEMNGQHIEGEDKGSAFHREEIALQLEGDDIHPELWRVLLGAQVGFSRDVTIAYPADYRTAALAGRTIRYDLKVLAVREPKVPAVDDDMARDAGDFENLEALRQRIQEDLGRRKEHQAAEAVRQALLSQLLERHEFAVPAVLVEQEVRQRLENMAHELARQGVDPTQAGVDWPKEKERQEQKVRQDIRAARLLDAIAAAESIEADDEAVERQLEQEAKRHGKPLAALRPGWEKEGRISGLRRHLGREAVLDFLISVGHIHDEGETA